MNTSNEKVIFDSNWFKVKETPKGFFYGERKGVDSIAILPFYYNPILENYCIVIRLQPMPLDNSKDGQKLFPCPVTGSLLEKGPSKETLFKAVYEELEEELNVTEDWVIGIRQTKSIISTTQMNETVHCFLVEIQPGSFNFNGGGDGSVFEAMSCNVSVPLKEFNKTFAMNGSISKLIRKENLNIPLSIEIADLSLSTLPFLASLLKRWDG